MNEFEVTRISSGSFIELLRKQRTIDRLSGNVALCEVAIASRLKLLIRSKLRAENTIGLERSIARLQHCLVTQRRQLEALMLGFSQVRSLPSAAHVTGAD